MLLLNDDYTPMEFVVHVLEKYFSKGREEATRIMLHVHHKGVGICGVYTLRGRRNEGDAGHGFFAPARPSSSVHHGERVGKPCHPSRRALKARCTARSKYANERSHEYATLEHLLARACSMTAMPPPSCAPATSISRRCARRITDYLDNELGALVSKDATEAQPTTGFQRVIHRAVVHVQSSGREEVTGANVLVAIFAERESHAAFFLQEQEMTRFDAVQYISHGIAKRPGMSEPRHVRGVDEDADREGEDEKKPGQDALNTYCVNLNKKARDGKHRSADRARAGSAAHDPGAVPPPEEQPAVRRRSRRRQDGDRRRPRPQDHQAARCPRC